MNEYRGIKETCKTRAQISSNICQIKSALNMCRHNSWCAAATKRASEYERRTELLTPQCHKDGEEDGGRIVEQVAGPGRAASRDQFPVAAGSVTHWAHGDVISLVADLHAE